MSATACQLTTFFIGVAEICFMTAPVGNCPYCCSRNDDVDIQYRLFTRYNPTQHQSIRTNDFKSLRSSNFNSSRPTVMYISGFTESPNSISTRTLRDAFLSRADYNFIAVDWARLVAFPWYISAVSNARYMGPRLADFIQFLIRGGMRLPSFHIIGFSLGAEAAGFAGKVLKSRGLRLNRISGLDPAYPGYALGSRNDHLSKGDATFVDVVHTNPGILGFATPIGDVDFYANHGRIVQPGCWIHQLIKDHQLPYFMGCSHNRAWRLYAESVRNPQGFPSTMCRNWHSPTSRCQFTTDGQMGFAAQKPMQGAMYFETNEHPPFAKPAPRSTPKQNLNSLF